MLVINGHTDAGFNSTADSTQQMIGSTKTPPRFATRRTRVVSVHVTSFGTLKTHDIVFVGWSAERHVAVPKVAERSNPILLVAPNAPGVSSSKQHCWA